MGVKAKNKLTGHMPKQNDIFESVWRKIALIGIPIGMLAILIDHWLSTKTNSASDINTYLNTILVMLLIGFFPLIILRKVTVKMFIFALISLYAVSSILKQAYALFHLTQDSNALNMLSGTVYWTPMIYLLCFILSNTYGKWLASLYTASSILIASSYLLIHSSQMRPENWLITSNLLQMNLAYLLQLTLCFGLIHLKSHYNQTCQKAVKWSKVAQTDPLTGLPNRMILQKALDRAIRDADEKGHKLSVLFIDVDRFKIINDTLGHQIGDMLLEQVSQRLIHTVKKGDFVARISGDEFVVISRKIDGPQTVSMLSSRILAAFHEPFNINGQSLNVTVSIGSCLYPDDGTEAEALLRNADSAMYKVKKQGKNGVKAYEHSDATLEHRWQLEQDLKTAIEHGQLSLYYQPMYDLNSGRLVKFETLLRWKHPKKGFISPAEFIPLAEESGLIVTLGAWVLEEACHQAKSWQRLGHYFKVSVNVSLLQFSHPNFVLAVLNAVKESGLPGSYLELEITESVVMNRPREVNQILNQLKAEGIHLAIDDFGTGYSSLAYLRDLPIDTVKIDQSFVHNLEGDNQDPFSKALVSTIVELAQHLELEVVAEGIETAEQCELLKHLGCHIGQGYYFSKPIPPQDLETFLLKLRRKSTTKIPQLQ